jgi:tRNA splicing endonuclease
VKGLPLSELNPKTKKHFERFYVVLSLEKTEKGVIVRGPIASSIINAGFGTPLSGLAVELNPLEAVYLILKKKLLAEDAQELVKTLSSTLKDFWSIYSIYADLTDQGKKVAYDDELGCILQIKGEKRGYVPLSYDRPLTLKALVEKAKKLEELGWIAVLAIVDEHGTVTYYSVNTRPPSLELLN